jgi:hypothetical protein
MAAAPYWDTAVAAAAPAMPIPKGNINIGSKMRLKKTATLLATNGVLESSFPRKAPSATTTALINFETEKESEQIHP